ncbi:MAG: MFS transporter [Burkholderiales bacterium]
MRTSRATWVAAVSFAQLVSWGSLFYTFSLLMPGLEADLGLSRITVSSAFSAALLASGVAGVAVGQWIQAGHGRVVMCAGSLLAGLLLIAHAFIDQAWMLHAIWIGLGLAMGAVFYEPIFAITIRRWPNDYRRPIIHITFLGGLASTAFIPLGAVLIDQLGWRQTCLVLAGFHLLICLPIHWFMLRETSATTSGTSTSPASDTASDTASKAPSGAAPGAPSTREASAGPSLTQLAWSKAFLLITAAMVATSAVSSALSAHMVPMLAERGLPMAWAVAVPASIGIMQVVGRLLLLLLEGRFEPRKLDVAILLATPAALLVLAIGGHSVVAALAFACVYGLGNGLITIVKATAIAAYVNRERVAQLAGLQTLPVAAAKAAGPVLMAALWSLQDDYGPAVLTLIGLGLAAAFMLALAQRRAPAT